MEYRALTEEEIIVFENNNCWAEDWNRVKVAVEGFFPKFFHRVMFYGDIRLGSFEKNVEVTKGFVKHSGINDATLRNVIVGLSHNQHFRDGNKRRCNFRRRQFNFGAQRGR